MHIATVTLLLMALSLASGATVTNPIPSYTQKFTMINGQIHTPGHVIINSPQPGAPVGGGTSSNCPLCHSPNALSLPSNTDTRTDSVPDSLHISLDVAANGQIGLPPYNDTKNGIHEIALFLTSRHTGLNLTISNPRQWLTDDTSPHPTSKDASDIDLAIPGALKNVTTNMMGEASPGYNQSIILYQEPGSTVKHIDFRWPKCFADADAEGGTYKYRDYQPVGAYNISIHQYSTIEGVYKFSVFDLPIIVKDDIPKDGAERFDCFDLQTGYGGRKGDYTKLLSTWYSDQQLENMEFTEYPWAGEKGEERTALQFSPEKVDEYVTWPREENKEEAMKRVRRDTSYDASNGLWVDEPKAAATSTAAGAIQTGQIMLGAAAAGLALVL